MRFKGSKESAVMDFSLIIPCFNEAENVGPFFRSACRCFEKTEYTCEFIFVDDGSTDGTFDVICHHIAEYRNYDCADSKATRKGTLSFKVVEFSRNFGKEAAFFAGLERAEGNYVGFIDADMQQDPETMLTMLDMLCTESEYDCIAATPEKREEPLLIRMLKGLFYKAFNHVSETKLLANVSDFRVFTRQVAQALLSLHERYRFSKGLFSWVGFKTKVIPYEMHQRYAGKSKWSIRKLFSYSWNGILAFSTFPLKIVMALGVILTFASLGLFGFDVYQAMVCNDEISMTMVLLNVVLLLSGIQMLILGVLGEYMARGYIESKQRPIYIAQQEVISKDTSKEASELEQEIHNRSNRVYSLPAAQPYGPSTLLFAYDSASKIRRI